MQTMLKFLFLAAPALALAAPLAAQTPSEPVGDAPGSPAAAVSEVMPLDARLVLSRKEVERAVREQPSASVEGVTRPWWHYPAVGAAIGITAGVIHARATMQGDYIGFPVEPMYLFPPVYGAVGAFLGILVDSADRERKAKR